MKLRVGDTVAVIAGSHRGKRGKVERVYPTDHLVIVEKIGRVKRHHKPSRQFPQGGIVEIAKPVQASNVMVVCPHCGKLTRVAMQITGETKVRVCKRCKKSLDPSSRKK